MGLKVAIDDERSFTQEQVDILFRTPESAEHFLKDFTTQEIEILHMDNDLGEGHTEGRNVLRNLLVAGVKPKTVVLITANPVARNAMEKDLLDYRYVRFNEKVWKLDQS